MLESSSSSVKEGGQKSPVNAGTLLSGISGNSGAAFDLAIQDLTLNS